MTTRQRKNGKFIAQPDIGDTKVCSNCSQNKKLDQFRLDKRSPVPGKRHAQCHVCTDLRHKKPNTVLRRIYSRKYYLENRTRSSLIGAVYRANNKEKRRVARRLRERRLQSNPIFVLRKRISVSVRNQLRQRGKSKGGKSSWTFIPYTKEDLKLHLESLFEPWMTWNNMGRYDPSLWNDNDPTTWKWQIDHIIPHSEFAYESLEDASFQDCWALSNLRPLSAKQNYIEGMCSRVRHNKNVRQVP